MINYMHVPATYQEATGATTYGLTNDYMFRAVFQKSETALRGLISSVLHMKPEEISRVVITNPIKLGEQIDDKTFILDIEVLLNDNRLINLEMQMANQHNWQDRSLSYLCRSFDQLYQAEEYTTAKPVTHIGFLNFTLFPEKPEFYATYKFLNTKNHMVFSDKITLNVVDLKHIELATDEDNAWQIDYWAKLFTATTWEELKMIADNNVYLEAATQTMYELSADEMVERQCRARRDYYKQVNTHNRTVRELEEALAENERLRKRIAELEGENHVTKQ